MTKTDASIYLTVGWLFPKTSEFDTPRFIVYKRQKGTKFSNKTPASLSSNGTSTTFFWRDSPLVGFGLLLIHEDFCGFLITHNDTAQPVGLLWASEQSVAETSIWQHLTITTERHPRPWRDSNPRSQQAVVLYGCETWSLTLRGEHRLGVFENRVLRRIFGSKRDEVTGEWRKLHNEELNDLYCSPNIVRVIK